MFGLSSDITDKLRKLKVPTLKGISVQAFIRSACIRCFLRKKQSLPQIAKEFSQLFFFISCYDKNMASFRNPSSVKKNMLKQNLPLTITVSLLLIQAHISMGIGSWNPIIFSNKNLLPPSGLYGQAGAFMNRTNEYLIFGGKDASLTYNSLYSINLSTLKLSKITTSTSPPKTTQMGFISVSETGDFFVHGGTGTPSCIKYRNI